MLLFYCFIVDLGNLLIQSFFSDKLSTSTLLVLNIIGNIEDTDVIISLLISSYYSWCMLHSHILALSLFSMYLLLKENKIYPIFKVVPGYPFKITGEVIFK